MKYIVYVKANRKRGIRMKTFGKVMVGAYKVGITLTTIGYVGAVIAITILKKRMCA